MNLKNKKNLIKTAALGAAMVIIGIIIFLAAGGNPHQQRTMLTQFVLSGGAIVWFIQIPLSIITIGLIIDYCLNIKASALLPSNFGAEIIKNIRINGWQKLDRILAGENDLVSVAILAAVRNKFIDRRQVEMQLQMQNAVMDTLKQQSRALLRKIEMLNIIGNVSPMIGLFGTVYGMIKLFNSIVVAGGQPSPEQMADGISVALVTTFWGLLIAIPALVVHSFFSNKIESIAHQAAIGAEMVLVEIKNSIDNPSQRQ
ncbi:MAG: MotA/TolQ/ExbB proton channel family protein [Phycisphaerae bacterium]|nr:MotA/TolQ/ExbB proton channel family protein [Phycisphaerae bacterium]